jgi:hypothetical protein
VIVTDDRRHQPIRRDFNALIRDPHGRVSEAKLFAAAGKAALLYVLLTYTPSIIERWDVLAVIVLTLVAPDLLKKFLTLRAGGGLPSAEEKKAP